MRLVIRLLPIVVLFFAVTTLPAQIKTDPRVSLQTKAVEVVVIEAGAASCTDPKAGVTVRFKVTDSSPIDVRVFITAPFFAGVSKDFPNVESGAEFSHFMCDAKAKYTVYSRPAGSNQPWPKRGN